MATHHTPDGSYGCFCANGMLKNRLKQRFDEKTNYVCLKMLHVALKGVERQLPEIIVAS